ncbi:MAG: DNA polymerase III subunit alpha [Clostridia bacterium]|nr:DNA polymerase III subunit alpha [Clostridia bacterium]
MSNSNFVHLHVHSPFSFLDGASSIEDLVGAAAGYGMPALALTDHNNVSGAVRFHRACVAAGIKPLQGAEVTLEGGVHLTLLADGPDGYANLCGLLSRAHLDFPRGEPQVTRSVLAAHSADLLALSGCRRGEIPALLLGRRFAEAEEAARRYVEVFGRDRFFIELIQGLLPGGSALNRALAELAGRLDLDVVATNNVHYRTGTDFPVHDLLTCIRNGLAVEEVHPDRRLNAELYLKSPDEMSRLFAAYPGALARTLEVAERCRPALDFERCRLPRYPLPSGEKAAALLRRLVYRGARERYGGLGRKIEERLDRELHVICSLGYEDYFLIAWDAANWASRQGIRHAGRGSAADSAVAYCLGITEVDALGRGLLFERFLSLERAGAPDIDIDFDASRRDEVSAYVCSRYGPEHTAWVATYSTFRARSAVREIGKALGFPTGNLDRLAKRFPHIAADDIGQALEFYPELRHPDFRRPEYLRLYRYCAAVAGFPRFLGTHLGGIVISRQSLAEISPLQQAAKGVTTVQFDKDDVEDLGLLKFDILSLRTLGAVDEAVRSIRRRDPAFSYDRIPDNDTETYGLLRSAETVGIFQLESPAQRSLQSRLGADNMEDVVASVALIRPGPVQGSMVEPYINRRQGRETVTYLHPKLKSILEKTYGVVLFQEQVIAIATVVAGFTPGEADRLRRVMSKQRSMREMQAIGEEFVAKAVANGMELGTARRIFDSLKGYAGYGFCEAHAAAFATTAYRTAYLARHHPAEYFAAILSNQPMGYYHPDTICNVARSRGVEIRPPDINISGAGFEVEDGGIRVPLSRVRGMTGPILQDTLRSREDGGSFRSFADFRERVRVPVDILVNLILCGAFDSLHPNRRALLGRLREAPFLKDGLFPNHRGKAVEEGWPDFSPEEKRAYAYRVLGLNVGPHPVASLRETLTAYGCLSSVELKNVPDGREIQVAGIVIRPHRPPTRSGRTVVFFSLEDEFGLTDLTMFEDCYRRSGWILFAGASLVRVRGTVQRRGGVAVIANQVNTL